MAQFYHIRITCKDKFGTITINRPDRLNTLSFETLKELRQGVDTLLADHNVQVGIITGQGDRAFCAGADVAELAKLTSSTAKEFAAFGQELFDLVESGGKPFIAAINGYAFGGGCELALACPLRIASENSRLGQPEIKLGITTGFGGSQRLVRIVGATRAAELCLLGEPIDAKTALSWGLVNRVIVPSRLIAEVELMAAKLASYAPAAVKYTLEAIKMASALSIAEGQAYEANLFSLCFSTEDMQEGMAAFLEKRAPTFKGK